MIESQLTGILQDVTVYYTKKLDMYRIKMEHHQRTRPDRAHYELASILIESYEDHPNRDELWKDMFCRLVEDEAMPYHATAIQRWMQEELQIKAAMRACIQDLRRERDKVCVLSNHVLEYVLIRANKKITNVYYLGICFSNHMYESTEELNPKWVNSQLRSKV